MTYGEDSDEIGEHETSEGEVVKAGDVAASRSSSLASLGCVLAWMALFSSVIDIS